MSYRRTVVMILLVSLVALLPMNAIAEECDSVECYEGPEEAVSASWIYFTFPGPGSIKLISYSNAAAVDLRIGTRDCCILDDVVEIYVDDCLVGVHRSKDGISTAYQTVSLQAGTHTIRLVNTESSISASGWYYELTSSSYTGSYPLPCLPTLEYDWSAPPSALLGENHDITLQVYNPTSEAQVASFSLEKELVNTAGTFLWDPGYEDSIRMEEGGSGTWLPYNEGEIINRIIGPGETKHYFFHVTNSWNWIEPWDVTRFMDIGINLMLSYPGLEVVSITKTVADTILSFVPSVEEITYLYIGTADSQPSGMEVTLGVPEAKYIAFATSILSGVGAGKATSAGIVLLLVPGAGWGAAAVLFATEAILIAAGEVLYVVAVDPIEEFMQLAVPVPTIVPEIDQIENPAEKAIAETALDFLAIAEALQQSYLRYDAAEDVNALEWMAVQWNLVNIYATQAADSLYELQSLVNPVLQDLPVMGDDEIAECKQYLNDFGLPEIEEDVLVSLGYNIAEILEVENAVLNFPNNYYIYCIDLPQTLSNLGGGLYNFSQELPSLAEGSIVATVDFDPDALNINSKSKWVTIYIELPEGYSVENIDLSTVSLMGVAEAVSDPKYGWVKSSESYLMDHDSDGIIERMIKFDAGNAQALLVPGLAGIAVTGELTDGTVFGGSDMIKVIDE